MNAARLVAAGALLAALAACSNAPPGDARARGIAALEAGQAATARVEFLNAVEAAPSDPELRILKARALLALGEGAGAEAEIARGRKLGAARAATAHWMAEALLLQDKAGPALEEAELVPPGRGSDRERLRGRALAALGDRQGALSALERALALDPDDAAAHEAAARVKREGGDLAGAIAAADRAVAADPSLAGPLVLRGELTRSQYGLRAAIPWFDRALEVDPGNVTALLERAATHGDMGRAGAMLADTRAALRAGGPDLPFAWFLQAALAARAGDYPLARTLYQRTGGAFDDKPAGMLLAGAVEYRSGAIRLAISRLERLVRLQPGNRKARRLLAAAYWKAGETDNTIETLRPIADRADADSYSLTLIARALAKRGDRRGADHYRLRAAQPQLRAPAALYSEPVDDARLAVLRAEAAGGEAPARIALVGALLSRGLGGEALGHARAIAAEHPGVADTHMLVGDALGAGGDFRGAAEAYRRAANIAFTEPVAMRLIEALERSGQGAAAAQVLALFLDQNPRNVAAQTLAANRYVAAGDWAAAIPLYEGLRARIGDNDAALLNNLAWAYAAAGEEKRALPFARRAWQLDPANAATADTYGWVLFKTKADRIRGLALLRAAAGGK